MVGDGRRVDFYELFNVVKGKGGYDAVCESMSWGAVAFESGLDYSFGSSVKLIYNKYLSALDSWLKEVSGCGDGGKVPMYYALVDSRHKFRKQMMELHNGFAGLCVDFINENNESGNVDGGGDGEEFKRNVDEYLDGKEVSPSDGVEGVSLESSGENGGHHDVETMKCVLNEAVFERYLKGFDDEHTMQVMEKYGGVEVPAKEVLEEDSMLRQLGTDSEDIDELMSFNRSDSNEDTDDMVSSGKRKRDLFSDLLGWDSGFSYDKTKKTVKDMLRWVSGVATNPCDPIVDFVPERTKWNSCGGNAEWKKVLLLREATFANRSFESRTEQKHWLSQKSHPSLYVENPEVTIKFRERMRSNSTARKSSPPVRSSLESLEEDEGDVDTTPTPLIDNHAENQLFHSSNSPSGDNVRRAFVIHVGPHYQAVLPDWTEVPSESDTKWHGTRIWPLEKGSSRFLIERDPIGKGRQDTCGCPEPGSEECVRFHISEKRAKIKLELGPAFTDFSFDKIGEGVRRLWTYDEVKKFKDVVQSVIISSSQFIDKYFWDDIFRSFPNRSREDLVNYYYNVFLYQRRAYQNRNTPDAISSDDEITDTRCTFGRITQKPGNQRQKSCRSVLLTLKKLRSNGR